MAVDSINVLCSVCGREVKLPIEASIEDGHLVTKPSESVFRSHSAIWHTGSADRDNHDRLSKQLLPQG